ncbi:MAG: hypothetical protein II517_03010, partial [Ruminococcus sp.]|nr:hypothetical protein [Ruminococcus sp.]
MTSTPFEKVCFVKLTILIIQHLTLFVKHFLSDIRACLIKNSGMQESEDFSQGKTFLIGYNGLSFGGSVIGFTLFLFVPLLIA